ncbi:MAG: hypothetical protein GY934_09385 [Gammaproteobacteria bacterium]|nr:hypothetical protein [Gammaproteobacteria bacterium]
MNRYYLLVLTFLLMTGCGTAATTDPAYVIPAAGSVVKIKRSLVVPAGQTRVYLQRGQVVSKRSLDRYYPSCNLEVWKLRQRPTTIRPGRFSVARTVREIDFMVQFKPLQLAALNRVDYDEGGQSLVIHVVQMRLKSAQQPNVHRLTCRSWQDFPHDAKEPTMADMGEALGNYASIRLTGR